MESHLYAEHVCYLPLRNSSVPENVEGERKSAWRVINIIKHYFLSPSADNSASFKHQLLENKTYYHVISLL